MGKAITEIVRCESEFVPVWITRVSSLQMRRTVAVSSFVVFASLIAARTLCIARSRDIDRVRRKNRENFIAIAKRLVAEQLYELVDHGSHNGRFLRHRFSPKPTNVATPNSLPKRIHVAKEAVSTAWQTKVRQRSE